MKFDVRKWERVWTEDRSSYEDTYKSIGVKCVSFSGHGDNQIATIGTMNIRGVFNTHMTDDYLEINGFYPNNDAYCIFRCYPKTL
jgi:hypothetical protein